MITPNPARKYKRLETKYPYLGTTIKAMTERLVVDFTAYKP